MVIDLLHIFGKVVGQPESLEEARLVNLVDGRESLIERRVRVRSVNIVDVDGLTQKLLARLCIGLDIRLGSTSVGVEAAFGFCIDRESLASACFA